MESIWAENRIRAGLPPMAYPLYGHGGAGFKPGNELIDFIEPSSRVSSRDHRSAGSPRPAACCRPLRRAALEDRVKASWLHTGYRGQRLQFAGRDRAPQHPATRFRNGQEP